MFAAMQSGINPDCPETNKMARMYTTTSKRRAIFVVIALVMISPSLSAESPIQHWPQFRGPGGQGILGSLKLPVEWEKQDALWKTTIPGYGHSSPVHDGNRIWLTTAHRSGKSMGFVCIDAKTGELIHSKTIFQPEGIEKIHHDNSYASPTPVLVDGKLIVHFGTYGTACIDTKTTDIVWKNTDFPVEHQGGPGSSPIVFEDLVILTLDGAQRQRVVALDLNDGTVRWERARSAPLRSNPINHRAFSTPLLIEYDGKPQLISPGPDQCHAYHPRTGDELWHVRYIGFSNVPCPVFDGKRVIFCTGFFKPELWAVTPNGTGDVTDSHIEWKFKGPVSDTPSPVLWQDSVIMISNKGVATCIDTTTGKRQWVFRVGGNYSASPLLANELIYFCNEEGLVKVLDPDGTKPKMIAINKMQSQIMASPVPIEQDLLIRTEGSLYRVSASRSTSQLKR